MNLPQFTYRDGQWHAGWEDDYSGTILASDRSRIGKCPVTLRVRLPDGNTRDYGIDLLDRRTFEAPAIELASRNGVPPQEWLERFADLHPAWQEAIKAMPLQPIQAGKSVDDLAIPSLPSSVQIPMDFSTASTRWVAGYIQHSQKWAPRSLRAAHEACALWVLSTVNAGRTFLAMGKIIRPTLFLAQIADSTLYSKTSVVNVAMEALNQARLRGLLAPDEATPQALHRLMSSLTVPADYGDKSAEAQQAIRLRLAFNGQRGWFYEEWGGALPQMTRAESPIAALHRMLRVLDDGRDEMERETQTWGDETIKNPALALFANATPSDVANFMQPGSRFWADGFWPRFAVVVPMPDETPSRGRRPLGRPTLPASLVTALHQWHEKLGVPYVSIVEGKGKTPWIATKGELSQHEATIKDDAVDAYYAYNDAILDMIERGDAPKDLAACYGRLHEKALRIALLLASFEEPSRAVIQRHHWAFAQDIVERWRSMLHVLLNTVGQEPGNTREAMLEERIESFLRRREKATLRDLRNAIRGYSSREFELALAAMVRTERIVEEDTGRTILYGLYRD